MLDRKLLQKRIADAVQVVDRVGREIFDHYHSGPPYDDKKLAEINRQIDRVLLVLDLSEPQTGGFPR